MEGDGETNEAEAKRRRVDPPSQQVDAPSIYLRGRYLKLSRRIPQSPWFIDGERKGESSVEELVCEPLARLFQAASCRFHAEGREDMDVRMLGVGRPFVVEVRNPRRPATTCEEAEAAVNGAGAGEVLIRKVVRCMPSAMSELQRDAENHRKTYVCICWASKSLSDADAKALAVVKDLEIEQKTPVRVLHRRGQGNRPRTIHWLEAQILNAHYFRLRLSTQAGTYVKEFVHGDLGRTRPSMRDLLGCRVEILQLDVEGLEDDADGEVAVPPGAAAPADSSTVASVGEAVAAPEISVPVDVGAKVSAGVVAVSLDGVAPDVAPDVAAADVATHRVAPEDVADGASLGASDVAAAATHGTAADAKPPPEEVKPVESCGEDEA